MKNFLKRAFLCIMSICIMVVSTEAMYVNASSTTPVVEARDESVDTSSKEKQKLVIPEDLLLFFEMFGYDEEAVLEMVNECYGTDEVKYVLEEDESELEQETELDNVSETVEASGLKESPGNKETSSETNNDLPDLVLSDVSGSNIYKDIEKKSEYSEVDRAELSSILWGFLEDYEYLNENNDIFSNLLGESKFQSTLLEIVSSGYKEQTFLRKLFEGTRWETKIEKEAYFWDKMKFFDEFSTARKLSFIANSVGNIMALKNAWDDIADIATGEIYNKDSLASLEKTLLVADAGMNVAGVFLFVTGATLTGPVALAFGVTAFGIGVATAFVHSETFAYAANNSHSFLEFLQNLGAAFQLSRKTPSGVGVYKPNIYIYNALGKDIYVRMVKPELLTKTIPDYSGGWNVKATGNDSRLLGEDGEEYGYLFYESKTNRSLFQEKEGFSITRGNRASIFENILKEYGFNETEIADFVEFWDEKLDKDKDYVMYPQYTEVVDMAMPVKITPYPEGIVRMWFAFVENTGQEYESSKIVSFSHDGYCVIEWGGMIFSKR